MIFAWPGHDGVSVQTTGAAGRLHPHRAAFRFPVQARHGRMITPDCDPGRSGAWDHIASCRDGAEAAYSRPQRPEPSGVTTTIPHSETQVHGNDHLVADPSPSYTSQREQVIHLSAAVQDRTVRDLSAAEQDPLQRLRPSWRRRAR